ncbi:MAG: MBL fold metallo-hydrolase [Nitrososphaerota archaeon]|nr:MBL fold metallo-hydrolase [Candidatus Bathyarchaeota archaeon]MDW8048594.1 MBL fold metallo-hydrolase [Nitrososphaerota archaeon]
MGSAREVGRAAISVRTQKTHLLLDYGVMLNHTPGFPMHVPPKEVDGIIMTHSHLDHSGAIPIFHIRGRTPVYGTRLSFEFANLLIKDFIHLSGYYLPFEYLELRTMLKCRKDVDYKKDVAIGDIGFKLLNSGHLPGGASVLIEAEGKRLLYTSDFNTVETRLLPPADMDYGDVDAVIIESTYADEDHTDRRQLEEKFVSEVTETVESGGTVLVPAFSIGRAQEIACILSAYHFEYPVLIDGMAREACRILMGHLNFLRDPRLFMDAVHMVNWVESWKDRTNAAKKPGVIISPAGMLKGGPVGSYLQTIGKKSRNAIFLVGYQIPGTPGRELLDKGRCVIDGKMRKVKAKIGFFDFSSHCGAKELKETVKRLKGAPTVYVVHGAENNCPKFAKWVKEETDLEAKAPKPGDAFTI